MATIKVNFCTDEQTKIAAEELFDNLGMSMTTALNIFLKRAILVRGIPFPVSENVPNAETIAALNEVKMMEANPERYPGYKSISDLKAALGV